MGVIDRTIAADVMQLGTGGVRIGFARWHMSKLVSYWALSNVLFNVLCVYFVQLTYTVQEAPLNGNKPHIRHGGLSRVFLC